MTSGQRRFRFSSIAIACGLLTCTLATGQETQGGLNPDMPTWSSLALKASKFGFSTESEIELKRIPIAQAMQDLLAPEDVPLIEAKGTDPILMTVTSGFMGRFSETRIWLEADDAQVLQWITIETGKRPRYKASRTIENGAWVLRRNPIDKSEMELPHEKWTKERSVREEIVGWPAGEPMSESAGIFYLMSASKLEKVGDRLEILVPSDGKVYPVEVKVEKIGTISVDFSLVSDKGTERIQDKNRKALLLALRPLPPAGVDPREFQLIGLEGDVDVWFDSEYHFPVQVEGKVAYAGNVKIRLQKAVLKSPTH